MRPSHATTEPDVTRAETLQNVHALARESLRAIGTIAERYNQQTHSITRPRTVTVNVPLVVPVRAWTRTASAAADMRATEPAFGAGVGTGV
jgi:hypothetical protein